MTTRNPRLQSVVLDTTDARGLAEFYRLLLGYEYPPGDEPPPPGEPDPKGSDWLFLVDPDTGTRLAFQQVDELPPSSWPEPQVPQQLHLDLSVASIDDLLAQRERVLSLGGKVLEDRSQEPAEQLFVFADPAGHPFCIFVGPSA